MQSFVILMIPRSSRSWASDPVTLSVVIETTPRKSRTPSGLPDGVRDFLGVVSITTDNVTGSDAQLREDLGIIKITNDCIVRKVVLDKASWPTVLRPLDLGEWPPGKVAEGLAYRTLRRRRDVERGVEMWIVETALALTIDRHVERMEWRRTVERLPLVVDPADAIE